MDAAHLLDGLDPSQRRAVASEAQPLAILAGAGSGKTRVLTRRIAHRCLTGAADPRHVLALTFTRRAAGELDTRLRAFGLRDLPAAGTFHAVAYAQLRNRWTTSGQAAPTLLDTKARVLGRIVEGGRGAVSDVATEIEWAKARLVSPERYPLAAAQADRRTVASPEQIAAWYRAYEVEKRRRGLIDFDDLLAHTAHAIEHDPTFAAAQRWRFRHLFVDEFQDVNPLQHRLLQAWLGSSSDLTVVGDPNQAIYGWNGADADYLVRFAHHHPGGEVVALRHAYRSTPQILTAATAILDGDRPGAHQPPVAERGDGPAPSVLVFPTDVDEANGIARAVHDHHVPGRPWSAQAVLVRTNLQTALIEAAFRRAAIPYRVRGASTLLAHPEVKELLRRLERLREPLATTVADLEASLVAQRDALVATLAEDLEPDEREELSSVVAESAEGQRLAAYEEIIRLGRDLLVVEPTARTEDFGGWLRTVLQDESSRATDAVSIVTFHAAKGLEWPVVHVAGVEAGLVPIRHARSPEAQAEEQRLCYVALTRAADVLRVSWARQRTFGSAVRDRKPSPYLRWLARAAQEVAAPEPAPQAQLGSVARSRQALGADPVDRAQRAVTATRHALRSWREAEARKARVRPTVVLPDRTLEALATRLPATEADLEAVGELGLLLRRRHGARLLAIVAEATASVG